MGQTYRSLSLIALLTFDAYFLSMRMEYIGYHSIQETWIEVCFMCRFSLYNETCRPIYAELETLGNSLLALKWSLLGYLRRNMEGFEPAPSHVSDYVQCDVLVIYLINIWTSLSIRDCPSIQDLRGFKD